MTTQLSAVFAPFAPFHVYFDDGSWFVGMSPYLLINWLQSPFPFDPFIFPIENIDSFVFSPTFEDLWLLHHYYYLIRYY